MRKEILYGGAPACTEQPTSECMVNGTECYDGWVQAIYLIQLFVFLGCIFLAHLVD